MKSRMNVVVVTLLMLVLLLPGGRAHSELAEDISPLTIFDSSFKYLDDGSGYLTSLGNGKISIGGQTLGTRLLDTIGVQVTLQRWTGTEWINVSIGPNSTSTNSSYAYSSRELLVTSGYYYRVSSRHWIVYGIAKEEGTVYSNSLLVN